MEQSTPPQPPIHPGEPMSENQYVRLTLLGRIDTVEPILVNLMALLNSAGFPDVARDVTQAAESLSVLAGHIRPGGTVAP